MMIIRYIKMRRSGGWKENWRIEDSEDFIAGLRGLADHLAHDSETIQVIGLVASRMQLESIRHHFSNIRMSNGNEVTWERDDAVFIVTNLAAIAGATLPYEDRS